MNKKEEYFCHGCGFLLQEELENELGYIKEIKKDNDHLYCKRCYDMIFRNKTPQTFLKDEDYWNLFEDILNEDKLYVLVLDIFNIEGSIIPKMIEKLKDKNVLIVLNKRDLLPKLVNDKKIYSFIKNHYLLKDLSVVDYIIVSSKKKYNIDVLLEKINFYRNGDVFLIGTANVGKSSLLNAIINAVVGDNKEYVSTSYYAGTTLGTINVPFDENSNLIDTPGIINDSDLTIGLDKESLEIIIPKKEIRSRNYQLEKGQTLFITGLLQVDYLKGQRQGFTIYVSNYIDIHRSKLENSIDFRNKNIGKNIIIPPNLKELEKISFQKKTVILNGKNTDLVIKGLGWINFKDIKDEIELEITIPSSTEIYIRRGLI